MFPGGSQELLYSAHAHAPQQHAPIKDPLSIICRLEKCHMAGAWRCWGRPLDGLVGTVLSQHTSDAIPTPHLPASSEPFRVGRPAWPHRPSHVKRTHPQRRARKTENPQHLSRSCGPCVPTAAGCRSNSFAAGRLRKPAHVSAGPAGCRAERRPPACFCSTSAARLKSGTLAVPSRRLTVSP